MVAAHADDDGRGGKIRYGLNVELVQDEQRQGVVEKPRREVEIGAAGVRIEKAGVEVGPSLADGLDRLVEIVQIERDLMAVSGRPEPPELDEDPLRLAVLVRERERGGISLGGDDEGLPALCLCSVSLPVCGKQGRLNKGHEPPPSRGRLQKTRAIFCLSDSPHGGLTPLSVPLDSNSLTVP